MTCQCDTIAFYDANADAFVASTVELEMSQLHDRFLANVEEGGLLLDAGCGAGRDTKAFLDRG